MYCCAYKCGSNTRAGSEVSYHRFPQDKSTRQQWIVKVSRLQPGTNNLWEPPARAVLCSAHFNKDDYFYNGGRKMLKCDAVPTHFAHRSKATKRKAPTARVGPPIPVRQRRAVTARVGLSTPVTSRRALTQYSVNSNVVGLNKGTSCYSLLKEHSYSLQSPRHLRRSYDRVVTALHKKKQALQNVRRRVVRLKGKVSDLITQLKEQKLLTEEAENILQVYASIPLKLFRVRAGTKYTEEQRQFASTLYYYSPAAYTFARRHLPLPHRRTIQTWLSHFDARPGFTSQSFETIRQCLAGPDAWKYKVCCLCVDEMEIMKQAQVDRSTGNVHGFVDLGCGEMDDDSQPLATKALVILAVRLYGTWKLPLGYWFTDGCSGTVLSSLLLSVLRMLYDVGCVAVSVTADGAPSNFKAFELLGCNFTPEALKTVFEHPCDSTVGVVIVFDACHMLKLARTLLYEYKLVKVPGTGEAKWHHIDQLHQLQESEGLSLANRITRRHVDFHNQKMKVKLATQLLSASVANALKFLRLRGHLVFQDSEATETFCQTFDRLFDVLNSRSIYASGYKKPMNSSNVHHILVWLQCTREWLMQLEDSSGKALVKTKRRTCIIGFCVTIDSVTHLCRQLLCISANINGITLQYLLTYRLSQDCVELLFGLIRRRGGNSNNPNCQQFRWAYRAILSKIGVESSSSANVIPLDTSEGLTTDVELASDGQFFDTELLDTYNWDTLPVLSTVTENVCSYVTGYVIRKLLPRLKCDECRQLLVTTEATADNMAFLRLKNNGGLVVPSAGAVKVVEQSERWLRKMVSDKNPVLSLKKIGQKLEISVLSNLNPLH
jgi:hypothetical protein